MTMVYVRLSSSATNGASGDVQFSSTGAATRTVATQTAIISLPTISITKSGGTSVTSGCTGQSYTFTGSRAPHMSTAWTSTPAGLFMGGGMSQNTQTVYPNTPGTYVVKYKDVNGCESSDISFSHPLTSLNLTT
jgi:hypothetical protein